MRDAVGRRRRTRCLPGVESLAISVRDRENGETVAICISYSAAMISANEKSRIVTLLMRAGCELGLKFDDDIMVPRRASYASPSWVVERSREELPTMSLELLMLGNVPMPDDGRASRSPRPAATIRCGSPTSASTARSIPAWRCWRSTPRG